MGEVRISSYCLEKSVVQPLFVLTILGIIDDITKMGLEKEDGGNSGGRVRSLDTFF